MIKFVAKTHKAYIGLVFSVVKIKVIPPTVTLYVIIYFLLLIYDMDI